ncbi:unnamed protein product [Pleuronectes platessa]|uniref:Uncharacterized protein n=1 Tax=Pleuronectes platessa TaxID=8262 RepID=A0A9N7YY64_PLEPL|nr:unnamed protein product [Pleuronectes platessa]
MVASLKRLNRSRLQRCPATISDFTLCSEREIRDEGKKGSRTAAGGTQSQSGTICHTNPSSAFSQRLGLSMVVYDAQATWSLSRDETELVCQRCLSEIINQLETL